MTCKFECELYVVQGRQNERHQRLFAATSLLLLGREDREFGQRHARGGGRGEGTGRARARQGRRRRRRTYATSLSPRRVHTHILQYLIKNKDPPFTAIRLKMWYMEEKELSRYVWRSLVGWTRGCDISPISRTKHSCFQSTSHHGHPFLIHIFGNSDGTWE